MNTTVKAGTDYNGDVLYDVLNADGVKVGTVAKVLPENLWYDGTASISRPWVTTTKVNGYRLAWTTLKAAAKSF